MTQSGFELPISIPPRNSRERLRSLHRQLRTAILEGRLQPGLRLPPTRVLAAEYGVSRNTAVAAYDLLLSEGYLSSRRGAGTYVADVLPKSRARRHAPPSKSAADRRVNTVWLQPAMSFDVERTPPRFHFNVGVPDIRRFPVDVWRRLSTRALHGFAKISTDYDSPHGRPALRAAIASHVSFARAVACSAEDVIVTAGAQQAFDLLARILVVPKRTVVALENPGYPPLRAAFAAAGARIVAVPVDEQGLIVERLPPQTKIVCVTPSHQFPLGAVMSAPRRAALLEFAQRQGAVVIEDDYDAEFRFGDRATGCAADARFERYTQEVTRLYGVLDKRLAEREYIAGELSIADIACYPWIVPHAGHGQNLGAFPHLARWFASISARPATIRTYAGVEDVYARRGAPVAVGPA